MMAAMATTRRADMFTADGKPSDDDPREHRIRLGDERTTLAEALRGMRLTLELKCEGLDAQAMARHSESRLRCRCSGWCGTWPRPSGPRSACCWRDRMCPGC